MTNRKIYSGFFKNHFGTSEIKIINDFENLKFELDKFAFQGSSFDDFELLNFGDYTKTELDRFSLNQVSLGHEFIYELCDCSINILVPVFIKDNEADNVIERVFDITVKIGKSLGNGRIEGVKVSLSIKILGQLLTVEDGDFEGVLTQIQKKINPKYKFINCFGCNFSDYNPAGNSLFGSMLCFKNQKEDYLEVKSKSQFFKLKKEDKIVQETYCCGEFEFRSNEVGYRG